MPGRKYFSTFITGFDTVVEKAVKNSLADVHTETLLDGLIIYSTTNSISKIQQLRFFNNSYFFLESLRLKDNQDIESLIKHAIKHVNLKERLSTYLPWREKSFKIIASVENQFVSIDRNLLERVENIIQREFKSKVDRSGAPRAYSRGTT
ncbi:hypothetical protein KKB83_00025 [Patescibacteria group bacterium]|nr:hypothetical protein [Patescibacteria group bacterium]